MHFEPPVIVGTHENPAAAVVWLHGLGADGYDFEPIVPQLSITHRERVRFIFPHANVQPVTLNGGMSCRSWFDIRTLSDPNSEDVAGMHETNLYVHQLIDQQIEAGIKSEKIFLVGFSQGGVMALFSGLLYDKPLGGIMGLSTLLGGSIELEHQRNPANQQTPIFLAHGQQDEVLPFAFGLHSYEVLKSWGYHVEWREYIMGHHLCPQEINDISQFLNHKI